MSTSFQEGVAELLASHKKMGCRMSLQMYVLYLHLKFFLKILEQLVMNRVKDFTEKSKLWK